MAQVPHIPNENSRNQAETLAGHGLPQTDIAKLLGITLPTLHKYYRDELDRGMVKANATVAKRLFAMTETNVAAAIFWTTVRMGWSEKHRVEVTGADGGPVVHAHMIKATAAVSALMEKLAAAKSAGSE